MRIVIRIALGGSRLHAVVLGDNRIDDFEGLVPAARVHAVPNGIADIGAGSDAADRRQVVLHLSVLRREKGVHAVVGSAAIVRQRHPEVRFVIAGPWYTDRDRVEAERIVRDAGLEECVTFVGTVEGAEKAQLLREAAVMAFPTTYALEGHPLVVLESLSAGTPVVATRLGAIPEMIDDGVEGILLDDAEPELVAHAVVELLDNPVLRRHMGQAARERFQRDFTQAQFAERLGSVWTSTLDGS